MKGKRWFRNSGTPVLALWAMVLAACLAASSGWCQSDDPTTPAVVRKGDGKSTQPVVLGVSGKGWLERRAGNLVLHIEGTPYEMGYQHGVLLKPQIQELVGKLMAFGAADTLVNGKNSAMARVGQAYTRCLAHISKDIQDELRGLAEGAQMPLDQIRTTNMIPELFHCSGFAMWGSATKGGTLYHGRILDYAMEMGYHNYAVLIVAKPQGKNAFINIGYAGFVGSVTGTNEKGITFGEMGGGGVGQWDGMPMAFLMRKGLEEANSLDEGVQIFRDTPRTCEYYYVISDAKKKDARGLACTPEKFEVLEPGKTHPRMPAQIAFRDAVVISGPGRFEKLCERVKNVHGKIDGRAGLELMRRPVSMKSAIHTALFAPELGKFWVANAIGSIPASECPFTEYDSNELFAAKQPKQ